MAKEKRVATIMFVDLVGSSEVASLWKLEDYRKDYLDEFHATLTEAIGYHYLEKKNKKLSDDFIDWDIRGDQLSFIIASKQPYYKGISGKNKSIQNIRKDIIKVFSLALSIKIRWLFKTNPGF